MVLSGAEEVNAFDIRTNGARAPSREHRPPSVPGRLKGGWLDWGCFYCCDGLLHSAYLDHHFLFRLCFT